MTGDGFDMSGDEVTWRDGAESRLSPDGTRLTIVARDHGETVRLDLVADASGGFVCARAVLVKASGSSVAGTCQAKLSHLAAQPGDHDEGSFEAHAKVNPRLVIELTNGSFRVLRR